ncbi:hypothetical protein DL95DRAFT_179826 [Leptodontidium sp. 2 PMI_412]|nr:hypothetical protein DL95DRAFT_179826 [Leptodontidium sp. 2 PMI_412]
MYACVLATYCSWAESLFSIHPSIHSSILANETLSGAEQQQQLRLQVQFIVHHPQLQLARSLTHSLSRLFRRSRFTAWKKNSIIHIFVSKVRIALHCIAWQGLLACSRVLGRRYHLQRIAVHCKECRAAAANSEIRASNQVKTQSSASSTFASFHALPFRIS